MENVSVLDRTFRIGTYVLAVLLIHQTVVQETCLKVFDLSIVMAAPLLMPVALATGLLVALAFDNRHRFYSVLRPT